MIKRLKYTLNMFIFCKTLELFNLRKKKFMFLTKAVLVRPNIQHFREVEY